MGKGIQKDMISKLCFEVLRTGNRENKTEEVSTKTESRSAGNVCVRNRKTASLGVRYKLELFSLCSRCAMNAKLCVSVCLGEEHCSGI